ncbi:hypothetical protein [Pantoea stewartii]|uniref:hypothetical protein n=1 Tax=Pantoea stewartii TaxID=66269 RepID=UPI0006D26174|nr:hypothetical protein [Pantoea stewartii]
MSKPPKGIARFDSAATMLLALASALRDEPLTRSSSMLDRLLPSLDRLPSRLREWGHAISGQADGISPKQAGELDVEGIAEWMVSAYPQREYPAAFIGASNGALVHLAAAMGTPWLPQTFLCPVRVEPSDPDDAQAGFEQGKAVAAALLATWPRLAVHHRQDPSQDRLLLENMQAFRLKLRDMPLAFNEFLLGGLPAGGTLFINHCTRQWPVTRTSDRSFFQFGAPGGATESEYLQGGPRVAEYLARAGVDRARWTPPAITDHVPEAEWGLDGYLISPLKKLAEAQRWTLMEIRYEQPEALSFVVAEIYRDWYLAAGVLPTRLTVDSFILLDPWCSMQQQAIPFWLMFPSAASADALQRFLEKQPPFRYIDMLLYSQGADSIGLADIARWQQLLTFAKDEGALVGVDETRFPHDVTSVSQFDAALRERAPLLPAPPPLTVGTAIAGIQRYGARHGVSIRALT